MRQLRKGEDLSLTTGQCSNQKPLAVSKFEVKIIVSTPTNNIILGWPMLALPQISALQLKFLVL